MAHVNFVISQNAKWGHAGFYIDCHRMTVPENILIQKSTDSNYQHDETFHYKACYIVCASANPTRGWMHYVFTLSVCLCVRTHAYVRASTEELSDRLVVDFWFENVLLICKRELYLSLVFRKLFLNQCQVILEFFQRTHWTADKTRIHALNEKKWFENTNKITGLDEYK